MCIRDRLEAHDHDHEGHEHEGHDHEHEAGGTHPGEIVFKKALAEAVGLQKMCIRDSCWVMLEV